MKDYEEYIKIQKQSESKHAHEEKNLSAEGHRFDPSNKILMNMVFNLSLKGKALDIGCHTGYHTEQLKEMLGDAQGIDINHDLLSVAHKHGRDYCNIGDMHNLNFKNEEFDLVFAHEVLEHSIDLPKALSEIKRVLKPNGYLVFSVPSESEDGQYRRHNEDPHFAVMTPIKMRQLIIDNGFKIINGSIYNIPYYNEEKPWIDVFEKYNFYPHLHGIVQKI